MQTPKVSIILPTYNVVDFLLQCLESISSQSYSNYETIIIVDGATDGSFDVAKKYCEEHDKFSVYWQENAGSGPARNSGLQKASGEFIMFVDPDDWLDSELLERLVRAQQQDDADIVISKRIKSICDNEGNLLSSSSSCFKDELIKNKQEAREAYFRLLDIGAVSAPTEKLYRASIIRDNHVEFPALRRSQDVVFNFRYYNYISSVRLISYSGYNYRVLLENSSGRSSNDYYKTIVYLYQELKKLHESWNVTFHEDKFCSYFYGMRIFPNLQRCVIEKWDVSSIVEEKTINFIIEHAVLVKSVIKKIARVLILRRRYRVLVFLFKIIVFLKQKGVVK